MTIDELVNNLKHKYFHDGFSFKKLTPAQQIIRESEWTEDLLQLVHLGNTYVLKNFRYGLNMQDNVGEKEKHDYC
jgi:hypothetical protein